MTCLKGFLNNDPPTPKWDGKVEGLQNCQFVHQMESIFIFLCFVQLICWYKLYKLEDKNWKLLFFNYTSYCSVETYLVNRFYGEKTLIQLKIWCTKSFLFTHKRCVVSIFALHTHTPPPRTNSLLHEAEGCPDYQGSLGCQTFHIFCTQLFVALTKPLFSAAEPLLFNTTCWVSFGNGLVTASKSLEQKRRI